MKKKKRFKKLTKPTQDKKKSQLLHIRLKYLKMKHKNYPETARVK